MVAFGEDYREHHVAPDQLAQDKLIFAQHEKLIVARRKKLKRIDLALKHRHPGQVVRGF